MRRLNRDESGVVMVMVAAAMAMLMTATALSVDVGRVVVTNRLLQSVADAVATDVVSLLNGSPASSVAGAVDREAVAGAGRNNFVTAADGGPSGNTLTVTLGQWTTSSSTFTPLSDTDSADVPDAVRVQAGAMVGYIFQVGSSILSRAGTASTLPLAGFSVGSYLASFDSTQVTVLNGLLGAFGPPVSITAVGYQGLVTTSIELGDLLNADASLGSVQNLLSANLQSKRVLADLAIALGQDATTMLDSGHASAAATLQADQTIVNGLAVGATTSATVELCRIIEINSSCSPTGSGAASASVDVLSLITGVAEVANGSNAFTVNLGLGSQVQIATSIIQPAAVQPPSPAGQSLSTQQMTTKLSLNLGLGDSLTVASSGALATATLNAVNCVGTPEQTTYGVSTTAAELTATVATALSQYASSDQVGGGSGTLAFPAPWTNTDGQSVATATPSVSFSFSGASQLPSPLSGTVRTALSLLDPQIPDILSALGTSVAGATVTSYPTVCKAPALVQ